MAELGPAPKLPRKHHVVFLVYFAFTVSSSPPPQKPGDFGVVNKKTGALIVEGNIYTHPDIAQIAHQYHPIQAAEVDHYQINSFEVRGLDVNAAAGA